MQQRSLVLLLTLVSGSAAAAPPAQAMCLDVGIDRGGQRFGPVLFKHRFELTGPRLRATTPACNDSFSQDAETGEIHGNGETDTRIGVRAIRGIDPRIAIAVAPDKVYAANGFLTALRSHPLHQLLHVGRQRSDQRDDCRYRTIRTRVRYGPPPGFHSIPAEPFQVTLSPETEYDGTHRLGLPYVEAGQRLVVSGCAGRETIVADRILTLPDREAAATRSAVAATLAFRRAYRAESARAMGRVAGVAQAARACLDDYRAAPTTAHEHLARFYFFHLGAAAWSVDGPLFERWITDGLARPARQSRVWDTERDRLRRQLRAARGIFRANAADPCGPVRAWRADGFTRAATPTAVYAVNQALTSVDLDLFSPPLPAVRTLLRRHAREDTTLVLRRLDIGVDEPDERLLRRDDPVWAVVGGA